MNSRTSKWLILTLSTALAICMVAALVEPVGAQQDLPKLLQGLKLPSAVAGKLPFHGLDALNAAKDIYQQNKPSYPTPNIAVSGNHIVIAWPNGVVTIETIADDGSLQRAVLGPPTDKNIH